MRGWPFGLHYARRVQAVEALAGYGQIRRVAGL
jgi:hypothetical protein